jgi:hypothetical protein
MWPRIFRVNYAPLAFFTTPLRPPRRPSKYQFARLFWAGSVGKQLIQELSQGMRCFHEFASDSEKVIRAVFKFFLRFKIGMQIWKIHCFGKDNVAIAFRFFATWIQK